MGSDYHDAPARGRRCKIVRACLDDLTSLFARGGLVQLRGGAPRDGTLKLAWIDHERHQLCLLVHSNNFGVVQLGELLPDVSPFELDVLLDRPIDAGGFEVRPGDRFFVEGALPIDDPGTEGAVGWRCGRCGRVRSPHEPAVVARLPIVGMYCDMCAVGGGPG